MSISQLYKIYRKYPTIVTDTRTIVPNSIFFALKGESFNGNKFALDALTKGAAYAVVDDDTIESNSNLILVNNVLETLQELAKYHRMQVNIPIIGITGTNGKTTNKELINAVLSSKYSVLATEGNFNNHIGVPLTILKIKDTHDIAIIEMGANHKGEIAELCEISQPNYGLVTNVGIAHLEGFKTYQNIIETKSDLYKYVFKNKGVNFTLEENTDILDYLGETYSFIKFSCVNSKSDNYGFGKNKNSFVSFTIENLASRGIVKTEINTNLVGLYNQSNILAAVTIANYFDVELSRIKKSLEEYSPTNNRSQLLKTKRNTLILDAYNANPSSVPNAIENMSLSKEKNKIVILGDMFELGVFSKQEHIKIIQILEKEAFSRVILIGEEYHACKADSVFEYYKSTQELINSNILNSIEDSYLLIKGSRGMKMEALVGYL